MKLLGEATRHSSNWLGGHFMLDLVDKDPKPWGNHSVFEKTSLWQNRMVSQRVETANLLCLSATEVQRRVRREFSQDLLSSVSSWDPLTKLWANWEAGVHRTRKTLEMMSVRHDVGSWKKQFLFGFAWIIRMFTKMPSHSLCCCF